MQRSKRKYVSVSHVSAVYVGLGRKERALTFLEKGYAEHSGMMVLMNVDPELDVLHSDPRFASLQHKMGLPR